MYDTYVCMYVGAKHVRLVCMYVIEVKKRIGRGVTLSREVNGMPTRHCLGT